MRKKIQYDLSKLQIGDIFNYRPLYIRESKDPIDFLRRIMMKLVAVFTFAKYNHTAQVTGVSISESGEVTIQITEALPKVGVNTKTFNPVWLPKITIYRVYCSIEDAEGAATFWKNLTGCKYDMPAAIFSGFHVFFDLFRKEKLILDMPDKYFCSNGVALGFYSRRVKIAKCNPTQCVPGDINRNGKFAATISIVRSR